jgi:thioredoxin 1
VKKRYYVIFIAHFARESCFGAVFRYFSSHIAKHQLFHYSKTKPHHHTTTLPIPMSNLIKYVSDASFDADVLKSSTPVLLDFWAEWCGPCKMIAPSLEALATEYAGKVTIAKINVDENQSVPAQFGIRGIPTLILFKDGKQVATKVGAVSKAQLVEFINTSI